MSTTTAEVEEIPESQPQPTSLEPEKGDNASGTAPIDVAGGTTTPTKDNAVDAETAEDKSSKSKTPTESVAGSNNNEAPTSLQVNTNNFDPNLNNINRQNFIAAAPLSPMHPPQMHQYYYQGGQVPNSPATPSIGIGNGNGYADMNSLLGQQNFNSNNVFMRQQQYPTIPPLSPALNIGGNSAGVNSGGISAEGQGYQYQSQGYNQSQGQGQGQGQGGQKNAGIVGDQGQQQDNNNFSMGTVQPASPLFPGAPVTVFGTEQDNNNLNGIGMNMPVGVNMGMGRSMVTPNSPSVQYLSGPPPSPVISYGGIYASGLQPGSPDIPISWSDRSLLQQQMYPPSTPTPSPQLQPLQYQQTQSRRTTSFDGELLPPSALEQEPSGAYGTLFSAQQPWGYNAGAGPPSSPYNQMQQNQQHQQVAASTLQPNIRSPPRGRQGRGAVPQPPNFYPAATPGPPIQTTPHNKGPEGANLFIFHIPNHFTNLDMWHLFCHYGNLLSVRIMVEKDTGRSRGFGFVSYDSPDAAALAIKELNGFVIGNKRLKVQHKQIRQGELNAPQPNDHVKPQTMYSEASEHGLHPSAYGQQQISSQGNIAGGHQVMHNLGESLDQNPVESSILRLDSIGEALPEVSK